MPSRELPQRVLVTGGAGFIGTAVCRNLLEAGVEVRVLDALLPEAWNGAKPDIDPRIDFIHGDVRDAETVRRCLGRVDAVSHHAALVGLGVDLVDLPTYAGINDLGTAVLLAEMAAAQLDRLVLASSMVVYGEGHWECDEHGDVQPAPRLEADLQAGNFEPRCPACGHPLAWGLVGESAPLNPRSVYAATKVAQEHLASAWQRVTGGSVVALRYHNVYGAGMPRDTPYSGVAAIFRSSLENGAPPRVYEDGGQMRDFVEVRDVAAANLAALCFDQPGFHPFNVCSGDPRSILDMAGSLATAMDGAAPVVTGDYRLGDVRHVVASAQRASEILGYRALVPFDVGVREFATSRLRGATATRATE